jgi:mannose-6-phosphate isomerase-like protein (cupin superfamily)
MILGKNFHPSTSQAKRPKSGFHSNIEDLTEENQFFRRVLYTAEHIQLVVMSLRPSEEIGLETHLDRDQFIRIEEGHGMATLNGEVVALEEDTAVIIPAGVEHNVVNTSLDEPLKLYTIYSPPEHPAGTIHETKAEAQAHQDNS